MTIYDLFEPDLLSVYCSYKYSQQVYSIVWGKLRSLELTGNFDFNSRRSEYASCMR